LRAGPIFRSAGAWHGWTPQRSHTSEIAEDEQV
jgi:hypothetical protein